MDRDQLFNQMREANKRLQAAMGKESSAASRFMEDPLPDATAHVEWELAKQATATALRDLEAAQDAFVEACQKSE